MENSSDIQQDMMRRADLDALKGTPEPWRVAENLVPNDVFEGFGPLILVETEDSHICSLFDDNPADAARIVACVNACAGINPEAVPGLLVAARGALAALSQNATFPADVDAARKWLTDALDKATTTEKETT